MFGIGSIIGGIGNLINGIRGGGGVQGAAGDAKNQIDAATTAGLQNQVKNAWDQVAVQAVTEASGVTQKATQA